MKSSKTLETAIGFVLTLLAASTATAGIIGYHFRDDGMGNGLIAVRILLELRLTDAQQAQMLNTFIKYQSEIQNLQENMHKAQQKLKKAIHSEEYNEKDVRQAFNEVSMITEEQVVVRTKIMAELRTVLTPDQIQVLKDRISQRDIEMTKQLKTRSD